MHVGSAPFLGICVGMQLLADAGVEVDASLVFDAEPAQEGGYASTAAILASGATAVFCHNDRVAMGLYDGLREQRVAVDVELRWGGAR